MYKFKLLLSLVFLHTVFFAAAQKSISEGVLVYNITVETDSKQPKMGDMFDGATATIYLKGNQSRSEILSGLGSEVTLIDGNSGNGVILKDYSGQKLMITLTKSDLDKKNHKYDDITFEPTNETLVIYGYKCKKAIAKLKDGSTFIVYYTPDLVTVNKGYDYEFKNLPGVPLQYEGQARNLKFKYTISKISLEFVPTSKFDVPKSGYRIMTYQETGK